MHGRKSMTDLPMLWTASGIVLSLKHLPGVARAFQMAFQMDLSDLLGLKGSAELLVGIARGRDAADVPLTHIFGPGTLSGFRVWADEVPPE